jgi:alpha-L-fucosidase 2
VQAVNLTADRKNALTFDIMLSSPHERTSVVATGDGFMTMNVKVKDGALYGTAMLKLVLKGGRITTLENRLHVEKAQKAMLQLVAATNFINPKNVSGDPDALCVKYLAGIERKTYEKLKAEHIADYQKYFNRFSINLGPSGKENLPTDARIRAVAESMDNSLAALYVQYGRYLMLSSSREGTYPANLQGIWNDKMNPPWDSKYTVNINTEMNYWPVEPLNIAECHDALFRMLNEVMPSGRNVAREHYGARGWCFITILTSGGELHR